MQDIEVGLKRSTTCTFSMFKEALMALGEVDLSRSPEILPAIIQVIMVNNPVLIIMAITEVDMGITPEMFLHINMVE